MPLTPGTWKANVNGTESDLVIAAPNQDGVFSGRFGGVVDVKGFWDEASQKITFSVTTGFDGGIPSIVLFEGWLFRSPANAAPGRDVVATLAGFVLMTPGGVPGQAFPQLGSARRNLFGWLANLVEVN